MKICFKLSVIFLIIISPLAFAGEVATMVNSVGTVTLIKADGSTVAIKKKGKVEEGDTLVTGNGAFAMFRFIDANEMLLRPDTQVKVTKFNFVEAEPTKDKAQFDLLKGGLRRLTGLIGKRGDKDADKLVTTTATAGIRGTLYDTLICNNDCGKLSNGLYYRVKEGEIVVKNDAGEISIKAGQFGLVVDARKKPVMLPKDPGLPIFNPPKSMQKEGGVCEAQT